VRLLRNAALSRRALYRHPVRTALAVSGTAVGVAAIVTTVAVGRGAEREVLDQVDALGRNLLMVRVGQLPPNPTRPASGVAFTTLRESDARAIAERVPLVARVAPSEGRPRSIKYGTVSTTATVRGTTPEYETIRDFPTVAGRYFTHAEDAAAARVAVLGAQVRDVLFPDTDPLGQWIRVGAVPLRVIGVLERKGVSVDGGATEDDQILIPLRTAQRRVFNVNWISTIYVQVRDRDAITEAQASIAALLRERHALDRLHRPDDFLLDNPRLLLAAELEAARAFRLMITGLGAVALVVGGVGIMSLMTLSVRERRNEVGLRVAVGARRRDVLTQFLVEAVAVTGFGSLTGLALSLVAVAAIARWTDWAAVLTGSSVALALGSAVLVGALFGVYPAQRAASWHPVTALRAE
jgi:putative ABC transport system permease protein